MSSFDGQGKTGSDTGEYYVLVVEDGYDLGTTIAAECAPFGYTIGRANSDKPDFILCHTDTSVLRHIIDCVVDTYDNGGIIIEDGAECSRVFELPSIIAGMDDGEAPLRVCVRKTVTEAVIKSLALGAAAESPKEILQILIPDPHNILPGEEGHDTNYTPSDLLHGWKP